MTTQEFSSQFDVLYNNIMSNQAPGLDEYEKSVFLTKAQDEILKDYFNPKGNKYQEGFDGSEKRQIDFSMIIRTETLTKVTDTAVKQLDHRSMCYAFPVNTLQILNESLVVKSDTSISKYFIIVPLSYSEYMRLMGKPYKLPLKGHVWRLLQSSGTTDPEVTTTNTASTTVVTYGDTRATYAEIIGNFKTFDTSDTLEYTIRYLRKPRPIILVDLDDAYSNVSINGCTKAQTSELDPMIHEEILQRAVELAKAAYIGDLNSATAMGQRSE